MATIKKWNSLRGKKKLVKGSKPSRKRPHSLYGDKPFCDPTHCNKSVASTSQPTTLGNLTVAIPSSSEQNRTEAACADNVPTFESDGEQRVDITLPKKSLCSQGRFRGSQGSHMVSPAEAQSREQGVSHAVPSENVIMTQTITTECSGGESTAMSEDLTASDRTPGMPLQSSKPPQARAEYGRRGKMLFNPLSCVEGPQPGEVNECDVGTDSGSSPIYSKQAAKVPVGHEKQKGVPSHSASDAQGLQTERGAINESQLGKAKSSIPQSKDQMGDGHMFIPESMDIAKSTAGIQNGSEKQDELQLKNSTEGAQCSGKPNDSKKREDDLNCQLLDENLPSERQPCQSPKAAAENQACNKGTSSCAAANPDGIGGAASQVKESVGPVNLRRDAEGKRSRKKIPSGLMIRIRKKNPDVLLPKKGEPGNERNAGTSSDQQNGVDELNNNDSSVGKEGTSSAVSPQEENQNSDTESNSKEKRKSRSFKKKLHTWFYREKDPGSKTISDDKRKSEPTATDVTSGGEMESEIPVTEEHESAKSNVGGRGETENHDPSSSPSHKLGPPWFCQEKDPDREAIMDERRKSETAAAATFGKGTDNETPVTEEHGSTKRNGGGRGETKNHDHSSSPNRELGPALVPPEYLGRLNSTLVEGNLGIELGLSSPCVDDYLPVLPVRRIYSEYYEDNDCYVEMKPISSELPRVSDNDQQMSIASNTESGKPIPETPCTPDDQPEDVGAVRRKQRPPGRLSSKRRRVKSQRADLRSCPDLTKLGAAPFHGRSSRGFRSVRREALLYQRVSEDRCRSCKQIQLACICWIPEPDIYEDGLLQRHGEHCSDREREDSGISQDNEIDLLTGRSRNKSPSGLLRHKSKTLGHHRHQKVLIDAVEKFEDIKEELKATALTIQEAITKLQHDYTRSNSGVSQSTDDGNHGNAIPPPERKLVRLCSRNRRCLSKLLAAEWKDKKDSSGSSSIAHSEHSTGDSTDNNDTDFSDSGGEAVHEAEEGVLGSNESLRDADIEEEDEDEEERPESAVTDIEACKDFVQGLANQVHAMQEALRKSKEDLVDRDSYDGTCPPPPVVMNSVDPCAAEDTLEGNDSEDTLDDGAYETPIKGPAVVHVNTDRHSQSDYEEVSDISEQNEQRSPALTNGYHSDNYINVSTYERTDSLQSLTNNNKETTITKMKETVVEDAVIYEFPPGNEDKKKGAEEKQEAGEITDEEPKAQFKYDGPLIFDEEDKKDIFKMREKDKVKKWDPVPILKELYVSVPPAQNSWNGHDASTASVKSGECSMEGYMDKLPMGRRRASLIKKWKRRYFRCKGGNLFYYEDHKTKKSLGYLHLVGGKVTEISNKVLEVTDMRGRVLLLRCASKMEFEDWKAILNAETGFYLCQRSSYIPTVTKSVVIVDLGSCSVRAGILSDCETTYPQKFFPSAAAISNRSKDCIAYGFDAFKPANRVSSKLVFPLRRPPRLEQFKLNIQLIEGLLDTAFTDLKIDPRAYTVLLVVPFNLGTKSTEKLVEMVFDQFHVEGLFVREQALMSLYSYKATTGIVVNIGEKLDVVPIVDGFIVEKGVCRLPFGGRQITETLTRLLTESGHRFFSEVETVVSRYLKEKACFVAQDYQAELKFCSLDPELCSTFLSLDKFNIPDGTRTIKLDYSRFRSAEGIFHPECWGKDHSGLHTVVYKAIQACNVELRRHMCKSIYLCGGTTLLPGLAERLRSELLKLLPKGNSVRVHASAERYHAAYHGACTLAPLSAFDNLCVTKDEWKQLGAASLVKWENL